ncbi:hypothetical protein [Salipiger bermudensis]|uniref:hypothetical protein n=1 Tax=Salipiger bermudensis TaxID=344736 RepID=UPI001CD1D9AD|nr:hypothetical protein [Salipiger bermudensis]MCA1288658.1 hypothetical protein [Salipiger bermudensis]
MTDRAQQDPVDELTHELTALRRSVENLARTSLTRDEAKALNKAILTSAQAVMDTGKYMGNTVKIELAETAHGIRQETVAAAENAARNAIMKSHDVSRDAAQSLSQAAGEARREAWRYFGGFWVWLLSMLAVGAVLGVLLAYSTETAKAFFSVDKMVRYGCEKSWFGGQIVERDDGSSFCAFWIKSPSQVGG